MLLTACCNYRWITRKDPDSDPEDYIGGPVLRAGRGSNYAQIHKNSGMKYLFEPIDDDIH
jgi:hypothetical protein